MISGIWRKYNSITVQAKSALWSIICSILQKGISFVTLPIFVHIMSADQLGTYTLYLSWFQTLSIVTSLYLYYGVLTNAMNKYEDDRDRYISSMQGLTITITLGFFLVFLATQDLWADLLQLPVTLIYLMFAEMLLAPALNFWTGRQRFEYRYKILVCITLLRCLLNPILGIVMVSGSESKTIARILSVIIVEIIFSGSLMLIQFVKGKCFIDLKYWKFALLLAIPLLPHYLAGMILNKGDQIMIGRMVGKAEVAYYGSAYSVGMCVQIFTTALTNAFTPWVYQKIKQKNYDGIAQKIDFINILVALIAVCLMLCSPEMMMIFGTSEYASAAYVIPPVAASVFFIYLYNVLSIPQFYFEKTKFLMISSILAALVNLGLNYVFIKLFGYIAAGYTTLICYILYSFGHYIVSRIVLKNNLPGVIMFNYKPILFLSVIVVICGVCCNFLFDFLILRFGILLAICIVGIVYRKQIFAMIMDIKGK